MLIKNENANGSGPVSEGNHAVIVTDIDLYGRSVKGEEMVKITLDNPNWTYPLRATIFLRPQELFKELLTCCTIAFAPGQFLKLAKEMFIGKVIRVEVVHRFGTGQYEGKTFANVIHYYPPDQAALDTFNPPSGGSTPTTPTSNTDGAGGLNEGENPATEDGVPF